LGAAIQAAWCFSLTSHAGKTLEQLCQQCVSIDPTSETRPVPANVAAYQHVYERYRQQLQAG
jgi:xylulokinase